MGNARMRGDPPRGHVAALFGRAQAFSLGVNDRPVVTKRLPAHGSGLGVQAGATPGILPLRLPADQFLLAGAAPAIAWFL